MKIFDMKLTFALSLAIASGIAQPCSLPAEDEISVDVQSLIRMGERWFQERVDTDQISELGIDEERLLQLWRTLYTSLQGEYVLDLAALEEPARMTVALLDRFESTQPYAGWLRTRLEYFEVASELRLLLPPEERPPLRIVPPPRTPAEVRPRPAPPPQPAPAAQQEVWRKRMENRPLPRGSQHYVDRLKPIFRAQGIPPELVWVAEVESTFNPQARSPVGAVGLFQFMPATARQYGLALEPQDERMQPEKSALAAARYLRYLHGRFGSWDLALAAYNAGEGRVGRLLRADNATGFTDISPKLPAETQMYVPRIDATLQHREKLTLAQLPAPR